jgi:UDP-glucose 4-epimerase
MPTKKTVLVVGGAGYIGANMVHYLRQSEFNPLVLDDLSTGHRDAVADTELIIGTIADTSLLDQIFTAHDIFSVMHFASFIQVGESVREPARYYNNNVAGTLNLLNAMLKHNVNRFIFSSTAAVYGEPLYTPIDEKHPLSPVNPYGQSKRMVEQMLEDFSRAYGLRFVSLRYFNAAGAGFAAGLAERHEPETHLIPLVLQAASGKREAVSVYGRDYPTPDGTCVRDYIHVMDLCSAHLLALQALADRKYSAIYNLGTGVGHSVQQVIDTAKAVTGRDIQVIDSPRRPGDPTVLVASPALAMQELNWQPQYSDLATIVRSAWEMERFISN